MKKEIADLHSKKGTGGVGEQDEQKGEHTKNTCSH